MKINLTSLGLTFTAASLLAIAGCATPELTGPKHPYKAEQQPAIPPNEARLVLYRSNKENKSGSPIIRIDEHVVGALNPGQYLVSNICQGANQLVVSHREGDSQPLTLNLAAKPGETLYLRVWELTDNHFDAERVASSTAKDELKKAKHVSYLVNRKTQGCKPEEPQPILIKEVELSADALFHFDSASLAGLIGRNTLDRLATDIQSQNIDIDIIRVVGHTDRLGSEAYNQKLSEERAKTVADYLRGKGLQGQIETQGMGPTVPVTQDCQGRRATPELIKCLQPDRRVSIELWGTKEANE